MMRRYCALFAIRNCVRLQLNFQSAYNMVHAGCRYIVCIIRYILPSLSLARASNPFVCVQQSCGSSSIFQSAFIYTVYRCIYTCCAYWILLMVICIFDSDEKREKRDLFLHDCLLARRRRPCYSIFMVDDVQAKKKKIAQRQRILLLLLLRIVLIQEA
jgi:hypothetical protein